MRALGALTRFAALVCVHLPGSNYRRNNREAAAAAAAAAARNKMQYPA